MPTSAQQDVGDVGGTADLIRNDGTCRGHRGVDVPAPAVRPSGRVIGGSLGGAHLVVPFVGIVGG